MMGNEFIKLNEYYYESTTREFKTRKILICIDDISAVVDEVVGENHKRNVRAMLKTGRYHDVAETFQEIANMIQEAQDEWR